MTIIPFNMPIGNYVTQGVVLDGTNDWMSRAGALTGVANSKKGTISFWVYFNGNADPQYIFRSYSSGGNTIFQISVNTASPENTHGFSILATNTSFATIFSIQTTQIYPNSVWTHVMASWDLNTNASHFYVNGLSNQTVSTRLNQTISYASQVNSSFGISLPSELGPLNAAVADAYVNMAGYLDLSVQANREKFILNGAPVDLGANGQAPTGTAPIIFFRGPATAFNTNLGTGGDFTVTGTLTNSTTNPGG